MDVEKFSLRISQILVGLVMGGCFGLFQLVVQRCTHALINWAILVWSIHFVNGIIFLFLFCLVGFSGIRKYRQPTSQSTLVNVTFLLSMLAIVWHLWL